MRPSIASAKVPRTKLLLQLGLGMLVPLILSGCFESETLLLDRTKAEHPLQVGLYTSEPDILAEMRPKETFRLSVLPDGTYSDVELKDDGTAAEVARFILVPLETTPEVRLFAFASLPLPDRPPSAHPFQYGVVRLRRDGNQVVERAFGDDEIFEHLKIQEKYGAPDGVFRESPSLLSALREVAHSPATGWAAYRFATPPPKVAAAMPPASMVTTPRPSGWIEKILNDGPVTLPSPGALPELAYPHGAPAAPVPTQGVRDVPAGKVKDAFGPGWMDKALRAGPVVVPSVPAGSPPGAQPRPDWLLPPQLFGLPTPTPTP